MYNQNFGQELIRLRIEAGYLSQRQFSLAVGISQASISRIEDGEQEPKPSTLEKMAPLLKVEYKELMKLAGYVNWE